MTDIKVSIVASAIRTKNWPRFLDSIAASTKIPYEVIFVGNVTPQLDPTIKHHCWPIFKFFYSPCKPAQCYEFAFREAHGELIHWTADDVDYDNENVLTFKNPIDKAYCHYKNFSNIYSDEKTIIAFRPIEDDITFSGDVWEYHHFFGGQSKTPRMSPFGMINREWLMKLGGYDRNFISGQSENDLVMRAYEDGGRVELCMDCMIYVNHKEAHGNTKNPFREFYAHDRGILENAWVKSDGSISNKRLVPFEPFEDNELQSITQGPEGIWKCH